MHSLYCTDCVDMYVVYCMIDDDYDVFHEKRWCLTSMSLTPSLMRLVSRFSEPGSSQSGLRWNANWLSNLQQVKSRISLDLDFCLMHKLALHCTSIFIHTWVRTWPESILARTWGCSADTRPLGRSGRGRDTPTRGGGPARWGRGRPRTWAWCPSRLRPCRESG